MRRGWDSTSDWHHHTLLLQRSPQPRAKREGETKLRLKRLLPRGSVPGYEPKGVTLMGNGNDQNQSGQQGQQPQPGQPGQGGTRPGPQGSPPTKPSGE